MIDVNNLKNVVTKYFILIWPPEYITYSFTATFKLLCPHMQTKVTKRRKKSFLNSTFNIPLALYYITGSLICFPVV